MTGLVLIYAVTLLIAALFSEHSRRTLLSSAVLFLAAGFAVGPVGLDLIHADPSQQLVVTVTDLALASILFADGLELGWRELRGDWRLPARALSLAMPLTAVVVTAVGYVLLNIDGVEALLLGAMLAPTDPVFAAAIVGREEIPGRVRRLLNVESGLNDGLALPFVLGLTALASGRELHTAWLLLEPIGGLLFGVGVALAAGLLRRMRVFSVSRSHEPLLPLSVGLIVLSGAQTLHVNEYLAAFGAGVTLAWVSERSRQEFHDIGQRISELLKLAAVLIIAVTSDILQVSSWRVLLFAVLVLAVARTGPILLVLAGTPLTRDERLVTAWFGPKGFASLIYALIVLRSSVPNRHILFHAATLTVLMSIVLHSSTDVPVARRFGDQGDQGDQDTGARQD